MQKSNPSIIARTDEEEDDDDGNGKQPSRRFDHHHHSGLHLDAFTWLDWTDSLRHTTKDGDSPASAAIHGAQVSRP